jgi:hypothetical protein
MCENCPQQATIIMGADVNAALGTSKQDHQNEKEDETNPFSILGPYGIEKRNERGEEILNLAMLLDLRVATSYFQQKNGSATWIHPGTRQRYQPDHIFITRKSCANMTVAKKRYDGAPSDHLAIVLKLKRINNIDTRKKSGKSTKNRKPTTKTIIDYSILRKDDAEKFKQEIREFANNNKHEDSDAVNTYANIYEEPPAELLERFEQYTVETAKKIAEIEKRERPDWFTENEFELALRIFFRNRAYQVYAQTESESAKTELKRQRALLQKAKRKAKRNWQRTYVDQCQINNFKSNAKKAWEMVTTLKGGCNGHHKDATQKNFNDENGKTATTDAENADIQAKHYHQVFNSQVPVDLNLIEEKIQQREINTKLGEIPTKKEIKTAINKSKTNKAPGFSGVTTDMLKNMPEEGLDIITHLIQTYWTNAECDYDSWHKQNIRSLYKGKGEPKDPNNWRGICLKETTAKVVSSIIAQRLIKQLDDIGLPTQYGNVGCQEAIHTLRTILMTR